MVQMTSVPSEDLDKSFGMPYCAKYWAPDCVVTLVSDYPFKRDDIVEIEETSDENTYLLRKFDMNVADKVDLESLGVLLAVSNDVPFNKNAHYDFDIARGRVKVLREIRSAHHRNGLVNYLLLCIVQAPISKILGTERTSKDRISWLILLQDEFSKISDMKRSTKETP